MDYIAVHFKLSPFSEMAAEIVEAEICDLGFDSFTIEDPGLDAYIPKDQFCERDLKTVLGQFRGGSFDISYTTEYIHQENWNALWESDFEPVVVGRQVTVKAVYHKDLPRTRYNVTINPQMSFGSGHHQTTCMMIESLLDEGSSLREKAVLDMGCGTGILAIVAAKLGAGKSLVSPTGFPVPVHAVDIDPTCVISARENARLNRVSKRMSIVCGDASVLLKGQYDLILANINRNILVADMSTYVRSLKPQGGTIIMSGFYTEDIPVILDEASHFGLKLVSQKLLDNWACIKLVK